MKHNHSSIKLACLFTLGALALMQGCSDDEPNDKPDDTIPIDTGGKNSSGGKNNSAAGKNNSTDGGTAGSTNTDAGTTGDGGTGATNTGDGGNGGEAGSGVVEPPKCDLPETGTNGCFNCPTDNVTVEWLNRCVTGINYNNSFDNATRVPLLPANGKLPPFAN